MRKFVGVGFLILLFFSCTSKEQKIAQPAVYFNLKNYFEKEAERLNKLHIQIEKSVAINEDVERKKLNITDFNKEFSTFMNSDINKASWEGSFVVKKERNAETYTTENEKIPVKKVQIQYQNNKIKSIQIAVVTENILYHSTDTLNYFPDSLYEIKKTQKIRWIKEKKYVIVGKFLL